MGADVAAPRAALFKGRQIERTFCQKIMLCERNKIRLFENLYLPYNGSNIKFKKLN